MQRYLIKLSYDGHLFRGWQIQNDERTVQHEIEKALEKIAKVKIRITGSGRTDSGVHALAQCAHFDLPIDISESSLTKALNSTLPKDIHIIKSNVVNNDFNARFDAVKRTYIYKLMFQHDPFQRFYVSQIPRKRFDSEIFSLSLQRFVGSHDFFSFSKYNPDIKSTICKVESIIEKKVDDGITITISANRFLHNMVRRIIGTSINIGHESLDPKIITELLENPIPAHRIIFTAPPQGLYLAKIKYNNVDV